MHFLVIHHISPVLAKLLCSRHNEALIIVQSFCEEPRHYQLRTDQETNLLLDTPLSQNPTPYEAVGKVHLYGSHRER